MKRKAYAKINLILDVVERLPDSYHSLNMIMLLLKFHDDVSMKINHSGEINLTTIGMDVGKKEANLVYRCLKLVQEEYNVSAGFDVKLKKRIPMQAGLGGGSSDAACALLMANELLHLGKSEKELASLGAKIGSDIPFFVFQHHAQVQKKGEVVHPLKTIRFDPYIILVKPTVGVSTKDAYQKLDLTNKQPFMVEETVALLEVGDYQGVCDSLYNTLEQSSFNLEPSLKLLKEELQAYHFDGVLMSGSGSCFFALSHSKKQVNQAKKQLQTKYPFVQITRLKKEV